ncbi:MAG: hypothetical protein Q7J32_16475, partial [Sphingomonadaceae bacterium]|nr:hypothetical protein [Sphingomonadaceae bacterium]
MKALFGVAAALLFSTAATAAPIAIDDFNALQSVTDTTANGVAASSATAYTLDGNLFTRMLSVNQTEHGAADPLLGSTGNIGFGTFKLSNDSQTNSLIDLSYGIDSLLDDVAGASSLTL